VGVGDSAGAGVGVGNSAGVALAVAVGSEAGVDDGTGVEAGRGLATFVTFLVKVQKVVGPFTKRNSAGLSGVAPVISTTISISSPV